MATHRRQAIREAVQARLRGQTDAGDRVFTTRQVPWKQVELPGLAIYALEESSSLFSDAPRVYEHTLQLAILAIVSLTEDVDNAVDAIAYEVQRAMDADPTFGLAGTVSDSVLTGTAVEVADEQGRPIGAVRLTYAVTYLADTVA